MKTPEHPPQVCERMRKVFNECYCTVQLAEDPESGRRRWELFKELPDRRVRLSFVVGSPSATNFLHRVTQITVK